MVILLQQNILKILNGSFKPIYVNTFNLIKDKKVKEEDNNINTIIQTKDINNNEVKKDIKKYEGLKKTHEKEIYNICFL